MPAPSLRSISGRIYSGPSEPVAGAGALASSNQMNTLTEKTESVSSDHPAPSSSNIFVPAIPVFDLQKSFPSILSTLNLMQALKESEDTVGLRALAEVFSTCFKAIVRSLDYLPYRTRRNTSYEVSQCIVIFTERLFATQALRLRRAEKDQQTQVVSRVIELAEMTIVSLRGFLKVAERLVAAKKPLPALPIEDSLPVMLTAEVAEETAPLVNIVAEALRDETTSISASSTCVPESVGGSIGSQDAPPRKKRKLHRGSVIRYIVGKKSTSSSKASLFYHKTKSSATLVNPTPMPIKESFEVEIKARPAEPVYVPRQSALYYLADPYCPEVDVEMPVPTGECVAVRLDQHGEMKAASLPALVRILTSKESVLDQDFTPTFFICFRFFTTPLLFFQELVKRFDEQPAVDLNPAQLRIWTQNAVGVHIRVGKAILMWLDLYWKPEVDFEVLEPLQAFALDRLVQELPEGMVTHILEGLDSVGGEEPICRRTQKAKDLEFIFQQTVGDVPPTPQFDLTSVMMGSTFQLIAFNTPAGRQEFARQLTANLSGRFQQVDPEDAVLHWHRNDESDVGKILREIISLERSLCAWVTETVLDRSTQQERCEILEFWLDIASRCLRLRNFSSTNCIWGGVSHGAIYRMKQTILGVGVSSKLQFQALKTFLGGQDNYIGYRQMLTSAEPTVPLMAPLIRDVISALAVVPATVGSADNSDNKNLVNFRPYQVITKTVRAMETCLIPYKIDLCEPFQSCLKAHLASFPSDLETAITDNFYKLSSELEPKEPFLNTLSDPWSYTMTGSPQEKYQLHELPSQPFPKKSSKCISHFLRRS